MELLRNEKTYNSNKKEQWKFLVIFPKRSTKTSVCFIASKILALLSLFSLFICKFQTGFLLTPIRRKWSGWDQVISSSPISDPPVLAPISGASPSFSQSHLLLKFCGSLMCCYSLFCLWFSDFYVWVYDVCAIYWVYDMGSDLHISTPNP